MAMNDTVGRMNGTVGMNVTDPGEGIVLPPHSFFITCKVVAIMLGISVIVNISGNVCTILIFIYNNHLRNNQMLYVLNLAITDIMLGAFVLPVYTVYIYKGMWLKVPLAFCKFVRIIDVMTSTESAISAMLITYDRFLLLWHGIEYGYKVTTRHIVANILISWTVAFFLYSINFIMFSPENIYMCLSDFPSDTYITTMFGVPAFIIPAAWIVILSLATYVMLRKVAKRKWKNAITPAPQMPMESLNHVPGEDNISNNLNVPSQGKENTNSSSASTSAASLDTNSSASSSHPTSALSKSKVEKRNIRAAHFLSILVFAFIVCWGPSSLVIFIRFSFSVEIDFEVILVFAWLFWFKSSLNPILYVFSNKRIRGSYKKLICWK